MCAVGGDWDVLNKSGIICYSAQPAILGGMACISFSIIELGRVIAQYMLLQTLQTLQGTNSAHCTVTRVSVTRVSE